MTARGLRSLGSVSLAVLGTAALGVAPVLTPGLSAALKTVAAEATLLDTEAWIMGGSGLPIPPADYMAAITDRFIDPSSPKFDGQQIFPVTAQNPLFTPEGLYPLTGVKTLELDPSLVQGVQILDQTIHQQIADGNHLVVLGYSQSATINSLEMKNLLALPADQRPTADQLSFVMLGDPSNPDGGLLSRFDITSLPGVGAKLPELTIPSLGVTFSGATPADGPWDTAIYTQEYDGFAGFPKYPLNFLADLNAFLGIMFVHGTYPSLTDAQLATAELLPGSKDLPFELPDGTTTAADATNYYMIPTENLPLLDLLRGNPFGNAIADLLQPDLKVLVNLGYGSIDDGWDQGPANVATPFGFMPSFGTGAGEINPTDLVNALSSGAEKGFNDFLADLHSMSTASADVGQHAAAVALPSLTEIANTLASVASTGYSTLLPTADIANALFTTLPTYTFDLFSQYLAAGDLVNALGMPMAAMTGLTTMAAGFEVMVLQSAASTISAELSGLFG
ncbi:PE-PPE domain-containing protein [Mycobacterium sp. M1]|uniref:PE-PPE domain-containing protein n=1 Tax=Mycolicibacter acidiphilus TaxID=2835306 RepID=A0ABS5RMI0_9MYCO|nr:PE-PPE domain-containing protein [Mycolicibacter acidiphilus]MBS9535516.1 PE-PPE domain-containing protein [Mycolicibacter acidiphilus]